MFDADAGLVYTIQGVPVYMHVLVRTLAQPLNVSFMQSARWTASLTNQRRMAGRMTSTLSPTMVVLALLSQRKECARRAVMRAINRNSVVRRREHKAA